VVPDYERERIERGKTRFAQCATCRWEPICEGPWREYPEHVGSDEFQPVAGARVVDGAVVLDARFARLGQRAPRFQLMGIAAGAEARAIASDEIDGRYIALAFYPEDGSPACTAEACSLQSGMERLDAAGIALVGISPDAPERHAAFARANGLGYPLLSDTDGAVARAYGAIDDGHGNAHGRGGALRRSTYLIDRERCIAHILVEPNVRHHAAQILDAVRRLEAPPRSIERSTHGEDLVVIRRRPLRPPPAPMPDLGIDD
jgi:peroxiredoxin Q/BCP